MYRRSSFVVPLVASLAVPLVAAAFQTASASVVSARGKSAPAAAGVHRSSPTARNVSPLSGLRSYQQVVSDTFTDPAGAQVGGSVTCPAGTQVLGGGAIIAGASLSENLNSTFPFGDGSGWGVYVNNAGTTDGTFHVYAVCASTIQSYSVVVGNGVDNPSGAVSYAAVSCPTGTVPFGGGGFASSSSTSVNLHMSQLKHRGWEAFMNNASTSDDTVSAYVVCGLKPSRYLQVLGPQTAVAASIPRPCHRGLPHRHGGLRRRRLEQQRLPRRQSELHRPERHERLDRLYK